MAARQGRWVEGAVMGSDTRWGNTGVREIFHNSTPVIHRDGELSPENSQLSTGHMGGAGEVAPGD